MEDFIYILIGIAWIGFSIYSQQKKLKKKQEDAARRSASGSNDEQEEQETAEKSLFEKLFEDYEEGETSSQPVEQAREEQAVRETAQPKVRYQSVEQARSREEIVEANSRLSSDYYKSTKGNRKQREELKSKAEEIMDEEVESYGEKPGDFDLRNAVIYSVILERPYD